MMFMIDLGCNLIRPAHSPLAQSTRYLNFSMEMEEGVFTQIAITNQLDAAKAQFVAGILHGLFVIRLLTLSLQSYFLIIVSV